MDTSAIIFYAISAFTLAMGLMAVTSSKIFRSAIWLLLSLVGIAALYFWMQVEFIAAIQIIVYVGGIVVLIIFSIFLTQQAGTKMPKPSLKRMIASALAALFGLFFSFNLINHYGFSNTGSPHFSVSVNDVGTQMLSTTEHGYILPFEVVSMLLLSAMVGCIVIAIKPPEEQPKKDKAELENEHIDIPETVQEYVDATISEPLITTEV
ncbi:NADH-quinone oxidoreductase subunit J family protein [Pinibacter soli]|uniref:NADH-quinone oxidoreductase subunit J n=1 Tax=Pinibacter soli TaxID=3044211 RepID=A0ABT6REC5_9BACT|nr:NADH-quinone oxidoreductase subunit J [Pinibacter soli]MDI3320928.1 NADH-quinone oxidoreductase subunit J [Pinibacter soli]